MNVVILCDYAHVAGGAERVAIESAMGLAESGIAVHFIAASGPVDAGLAASRVTVHIAGVPDLRSKSRIELLTGGLWSTHVGKFVRSVLTKLERGQTVVHAHSWQRALTASALHASMQSGHAVVVTLHEYGLACPNQGFFNYQQMQICEKQALGLDCLTTHCDTRTYAHKLWRTGRIVLQRGPVGIPSKLKHVIYLSELSRQVMQPYFGPKTKWHAVRNPIGIAKYERTRAENNSAFLFIGRVSREKGADLFAVAAGAAGVEAVLAGDGPELAALQRSHSAVRYLGWVQAADLSQHLARARVLVFPSILYETLGLTVLEALAMGVPVIVSDATAARESVTDGETGLLFRNMDVADLTRRISLLAGDDHLVATMSAKGYEKYWANPPTLASHVLSLRTVYSSILTNMEANHLAA